jgi:2-polyprenyl-6-methoxyphenol hydroxylase-like FAD-dependent oxidoreductase
VPERFDVIIVGARCAGSPLAAILARAGLKVVVVEQVTFPKETLSSHLMEADALRFLDRLGIIDPIRETGVRFMRRADIRLNDLRFEDAFPLAFDDLGGAAFLQRHRLDAILADAASGSGAEVRMGSKVVEVVWDGQRVCGVRTRSSGAETEVHAPLVVGADGRHSTVAYMCGSRKYNIQPNQRSYHFGFFEGADPAASDTFLFHRWGDRMVWGGPADAGLYLIGVSPEMHEREYFRGETEPGLLAHMRSCEPAARALANARLATRVVGIRRFDGYFRQAAGPGWVLVGDAGHFKDPALGRGIGDSFMQAETVASAIVSGLGGGTDIDAVLRRWWRWRDEHFEGYYWLASNLGAAGALPAAIPEAVRGLIRRGEVDAFFDLFSHRTRYDDVFPLTSLGRATAATLLRGDSRRIPVVRETVSLLARERRRRWIRRSPVLSPPDLTAAPGRPDPGLTVEAPESTAVADLG